MVLKHILPNCFIATTTGLVLLLSYIGWASAVGEDMANRIKSCPASPNCASSEDTGASHGILPLQVVGELVPAWAALVNCLEQEPGFTIIENTGGYLQAEARTRIL